MQINLQATAKTGLDFGKGCTCPAGATAATLAGAFTDTEGVYLQAALYMIYLVLVRCMCRCSWRYS